MTGPGAAWHSPVHQRIRRIALTLAGLVLGGLISPTTARASGFTITREVTSLEVRRTGHYTETVERTLRIDSPAGIDDHDQWSLTYNPERTRMEILQAWTQTPAGQRIPVPRSRIVVRERAKADRDDVFSGRLAAVALHPQVEVGSLLHVQWRATHAPIYPGQFAWRRPLDPDEPPQEWTVRLAHEPGMPVRAHRLGLVGGEQPADARGWRRCEFRADKEEIARSEKQRRAAPEGPWVMLALSTYASWEEVAREYAKGADPMAAVTPAIRAHAQELTQGARNPRERVQRLYDWVRRNIRYVALQGTGSGAFPFPAEEILRNRYGDCKDKSALLQALLAAVGIKAQTVLINHGWWIELPSLPTPFFFSHVMVHVPALGLYLDPTDSELPMGVLDRNYVDKPVLLTGSGQASRTPASSPDRDGTQADVFMEMRPDGAVYGSSRTRLTGHPQVNWRYELAGGVDTDPVVERVLAARGEWGSGSAEVVSGADDAKLEVSMRFELKPVVDLPGPTLLRISRGATPSGLNRYFRAVDRGPQACHSERHTEKLSLTLPKGRTIDGLLPEGRNISQGVLTYRSRYEAVRDGQQMRLEITRELIARCTQRLLSINDRAHRDELREVLMKDFRAQVVVK